MCKAFSCIVDITGKKVTWNLGVDSHTDLVKLAGYKDSTADPKLMEFAKIEITPKNGDYLNPDKWVYKVDEKLAPIWIGREHEDACRKAHTKWLKQLDKFIIRHPVVNPSKITAPTVGPTQIALLKKWDSVRASVWASVGDSVGDSVGASVWASVWNSVGASVRAYIGSFFKLPRKDWKYTDRISCDGYPFQSAVDLWKLGLVASYNGRLWRLHGGTDAKVLWEGTI